MFGEWEKKERRAEEEISVFASCSKWIIYDHVRHLCGKLFSEKDFLFCRWKNPRLYAGGRFNWLEISSGILIYIVNFTSQMHFSYAINCINQQTHLVWTWKRTLLSIEKSISTLDSHEHLTKRIICGFDIHFKLTHKFDLVFRNYIT